MASPQQLAPADPRPKTDPGYAALERRLNWRLYRDSSAGLMAELGSHQMDVVNWFLKTTPTASRRLRRHRLLARRPRSVRQHLLHLRLRAAGGQKPARPMIRPARAPFASPIPRSATTPTKGPSELILGTRGSLYLTSSKGLLFQEQDADARTPKPAARPKRPPRSPPARP